MGYVNIIKLLYLSNPTFKEEINRIRKYYNIPTNISPENFKETFFIQFDKHLIQDKNFNLEYRGRIRKLVNKFNLRGMDIDLEMFIETGKVRNINGKPTLKHLYGYVTSEHRKKYLEISQEMFPWFTVILKRNVTSQDLDKVYDEIKPKILKQMNSYFGKFHEQFVYIPTFNRIERIFELKDKECKSFSEIAEIICLEHPESKDVVAGKVNEWSVKSKYSYYKKRFKK